MLTELKSRLHISHNSEDESLQSIIDQSTAVVARMVGFKDLEDEEFKELVLSRSRYAYYDEVEYFEDNFHSSLVGLSLAHGGESDETTL